MADAVASAPDPGNLGGTRDGTVSAFDDAAGVGSVTGDDGTEVPFHCVAVADGSRSIAEGTPVTYRIVAGHGGRWEAAEVSPRPGA